MIQDQTSISDIAKKSTSVLEQFLHLEGIGDDQIDAVKQDIQKLLSAHIASQVNDRLIENADSRKIEELLKSPQVFGTTFNELFTAEERQMLFQQASRRPSKTCLGFRAYIEPNGRPGT